MISLDDRMKRYEQATKHVLVQNMPVIIRIDGRAFHTLTRKFERPFDKRIIEWMIESAKAVFADMQGCKLAYIQSDEASFVLTDYDTHETQAWFANELQKMVSISAALMTSVFTTHYIGSGFDTPLPMFDSRAFNVPREDVANYFLSRAQDWARNSLQMYARSIFSHKELHNKNSAAMHEMLHAKGLNWTTDLTDQQRNGTWLYAETGASNPITRYDILPNYESVAWLVNQVMPPVGDG